MALCRAEVREYMNKDSPWEKYIIDSNTRYDTATPIPFFRRSWKLPNVGSQLLYLPDSNQSGSKQGKIKIVCLRIFVDSVTSSVRYRIPKKKEDWVSETRGSRWTSQWTRRNEICLEWMNGINIKFFPPHLQPSFWWASMGSTEMEERCKEYCVAVARRTRRERCHKTGPKDYPLGGAVVVGWKGTLRSS